MEQVAFKMKLFPGMAAEYKRRHDEIWPELSSELSKAGVYDYSIFLDEETNILFAVHKLKDKNTAHLLPELDIVRKWWDYMADIMEAHADKKPVIGSLKTVFHLD